MQLFNNLALPKTTITSPVSLLVKIRINWRKMRNKSYQTGKTDSNKPSKLTLSRMFQVILWPEVLQTVERLKWQTNVLIWLCFWRKKLRQFKAMMFWKWFLIGLQNFSRSKIRRYWFWIYHTERYLNTL